MDGFFSSDFFSEFFDIGTPTPPQTGGGGWGAFMPVYQGDDPEDEDILLAWFMLMRQPHG